VLRVSRVPENRKKPRSQIRAAFETIAVGPRLQQRVVNEIVRPIRTAHQRYREGPQGGRRGEQFVLEGPRRRRVRFKPCREFREDERGRRRHGGVSPAMRGFGSYARAQGHFNAPFEVDAFLAHLTLDGERSADSEITHALGDGLGRITRSTTAIAAVASRSSTEPTGVCPDPRAEYSRLSRSAIQAEFAPSSRDRIGA
jgi:hypothetical protein